ncbi:hypothetical protein [Dyadobacter crusticola]|uniref:hypothetical protein n=1 Tax=Dyadobacter crusticola TaxID=292407 RepID=UPI0004E23698|nr:hypothetical protein [Dyadobacter crusticola]
MLTSDNHNSLPPNPGSFRNNKCIPKVIETEVLRALSHYPELKDTHINFIFKRKIRGSVMQAQPKISTMFSTKRAYNINISAMFRLTHSAIPIHQIPSDIIVGWIGHELGHVMDYENRSLTGMMRFGLGYLLSSKYVKEAERVADTYAVNHGLGNYILKTKHFILDHASLSEKYKRKIARLYLSPDDIVEQVKKLEAKRTLPS